MHKVSIIIPIYNSESYLPKCLDSVLNQTFKNIEIILINDGSLDNSLEVCKYYEKMDKRIKIIDKENEGVSKARNVGLDYASGEYVLFVDSDDFIEDNMIKSVYKDLILYDADMCICNYINEIKNKKIYVHANIKKELINNYEIEHNLIIQLIERGDGEKYHELVGFRSPWGKIFNKKIIDKYNIRFKEDMAIGEDFLFNLEFLIHSNKVVLNNGFYYHYVNNINSALMRYKDDCWEKNYKKIILELNEFLNKYNLYDICENRVDKLVVKYFLICINNEEKRGDLTYKILLNNIKSLCNDELIYKSLKYVKFKEYNFKNNVILFLSKNNLYNLIYIIENYRSLKRFIVNKLRNKLYKWGIV